MKPCPISKAVSLSSEASFDLAAKRTRLAELEEAQMAAGFWSDQERAREVVKELKTLKGWVEPAVELERRINDLRGLAELLEEEPDPGMEEELSKEVTAVGERLAARAQSMLQGPTTSATRCSRSTRAPAAPSRRTGPRC
ncbi:MAG: PCRF domain-containing protein [Gemmatimonadales bacterium]